MVRKKHEKGQVIGVIVIFIAMLISMAAVYSMEFTVDASTDEALEAAIKEYNFTTRIDVDVLEREQVGKHLLVLYAQEAYEGWGGTALLEKGLLGEYRFHSCSNFNWPLYNASCREFGDKHYLVFSGLNTLPGVETFKLYENFEKTGDVLYTGSAMEGPFLEMVEVSGPVNVSGWNIRYYDASGQELAEEELTAPFAVGEGGAGGSVSTAEKGMIYVFLGGILLLGIVLMKCFWMRYKREA